MKQLISIQDLDEATLGELVATGERVSAGDLDFSSALRGKLVGLYFSKPSTRTRTSFFAAVHRMGGAATTYSASDLQTSTGETVEDTGMVMGLYLDALVIRTNGSTDEMMKLAENGGGMAVVNALSKAEHPTQAIADLITIKQEFGVVAGKRVLYVGAWNNTAASLVLALTKTRGTSTTVLTPAGYGADEKQAAAARQNADRGGSEVVFAHDPNDLPRDVDVVYTVRWQSMGEEPADPEWRRSFEGFQVTADMFRSVAHERTIFMHDLPAHRGIEVEAGVIDAPYSRIRRQSYNKMISAMAVLERCLRNGHPPAKETES